jgi:ATP-binding cassette subfamily B protein
MGKRLPLYLLAIFGTTAFSAIFDVIGSMLMKSVFDIAQSGQTSKIYTSVLVNILIGLSSLLVGAIFSIMYNNEAKRAGLNVKRLVFAKSMKLSMTYYDTHHSGELLSRLMYDSDMSSSICSSRLRRVLAPIISVGVYVIAMLSLNPIMTFVLILINVFLFIMNTSLSKPLKRIGKEMSEKNASMTEKLSNMIAGMEICKMYDIHHTTRKQYEKANEEFVKTQKKSMVLGGVLESFNVGFDLLCALMFLVIGILFIQNNMVTIGEVAAIYTMYGALSFRFLQLGKYYPQLMNCIAYAARIFDFLEEEEDLGESVNESTEENTGIKNVDYFSVNAIELDHVTFAYDDAHPVLDNTCIQIPAGKNVALTGKSGCGKSTVAKLLLGFYSLDSGDIKIFGQSMKKLGLQGMRSLIAYVPQEPYLFEVSIFENINYGNINASEEEVIEAARLANADGFIRQQSDGYQTLVTNRGQSLSGGERQRIAIARAILKNAPIMVFDEATSALDNESERLIQDAIDKLKTEKTILTIAHRTATIDMADMEIPMN